MIMVVTSSVRAEKKNSPISWRNHGRAKAYLALLSKGPRGSIARAFIKKEKRGDSQIYFKVTAQRGDVYEMRRHLWDQGRSAFISVTAWVGFDHNTEPHLLTRDEAFKAVLDPATPPETHNKITIQRPERIFPAGVYFHEQTEKHNIY